MQVSYTQDNGLITAIGKNDCPFIEDWVKWNDVNDYYGNKSCTPLIMSIKEDKPEIVKILLNNGADTEKICHNKTPLIHAVDSAKLKLVKMLLKHGADINGTSLKENTAIIYAAYHGYLDIVKYLVKKGINYNYFNSAGKTALDYANIQHHYEVASYLRSINADSEETFLPDYLDGPYVLWQDQSNGTVIYLKRDSAKNATSMEKQIIHKDKYPFRFKGFAGDTNSYQLVSKVPDRAHIIKGVEKVFAMGDIHGGYKELIEILKNVGIVDKNLKWNWENGQVVFLGDLFDRGDNVTEVLWLIYRLQDEAKKEGGAVHVLLGNHELMIMEGFTRDISEKYQYLSYRFYNIISDESMKVRLARITWIDSGKKNNDLTKHAFFIEDIDHLATRLGGVEIEVSGLAKEVTERYITLIFSVFQYLIGNTDWSIPGLHNVKLISLPGPKYVPVPYDFDFSGYVGAYYAIPDPKLPIKSIYQRLYRGPCVELNDILPVIELFKRKKTDIYNLISRIEHLDDKERKKMYKFLDKFYKTLNSERKIEREFIGKCSPTKTR